MAKHPENRPNNNELPYLQVLEQLNRLQITIKNSERIGEIEALLEKNATILIISNHRSHLDTPLIILTTRQEGGKFVFIATSRFQDHYFDDVINNSPELTEQQRQDLINEYGFHHDELVPERHLAHRIREFFGFKMLLVMQPNQIRRPLSKLGNEIRKRIHNRFKTELSQSLSTPGQIVVVYPEGTRNTKGLGHPMFKIPELPEEDMLANVYIVPIALTNTFEVFDTTFRPEAGSTEITATYGNILSIKEFLDQGIPRDQIIENIFQHQIAPNLPEDIRGVYKIESASNTEDATGRGEF